MSIEHETIDETKFPMPWCHMGITSVSSRLQSGEYLGQSHVLSFFLSNAHEYSWLISRSPSEMALSFSCDWFFRFSSIPNHVKEIPTLPDCLRTEITIYWIHFLFIYFYQEYSKDILYSQCGLQRQPMIDRIMNTYAMSGIRSNVLSSSVKWHGWQLLILTTSFLYQESECCIETSLSK